MIAGLFLGPLVRLFIGGAAFGKLNIPWHLLEVLILVALGGGLIWHFDDAAYGRGARDDAVHWRAAETKAAAVASALALQRDAAVMRATDAETARAAVIAATAQTTRDAIKAEYAHATAHNAACLDANILHRIQAGDASLARATKATPSRADPVRHPPARIRG